MLFEAQFLVCGQSFSDTFYIPSLCLTSQLFRHWEVKKTTIQANFWAVMNKVGSGIELNCSFHVEFAIILQENWDLLNQQIIFSFYALFWHVSVCAWVRKCSWVHPKLRGVSVSAISFVTLPAVSSVTLCGCARACWRRQSLITVRKRLWFRFGVCVNPEGEKVSSLIKQGNNRSKCCCCCLSSWYLFTDRKTASVCKKQPLKAKDVMPWRVFLCSSFVYCIAAGFFFLSLS